MGLSISWYWMGLKRHKSTSKSWIKKLWSKICSKWHGIRTYWWKYLWVLPLNNTIKTYDFYFQLVCLVLNFQFDLLKNDKWWVEYFCKILFKRIFHSNIYYHLNRLIHHCLIWKFGYEVPYKWSNWNLMGYVHIDRILSNST